MTDYQSTIIGKYTKVLLVTIHHATGLKDADLVGKSDAYVKIDNFDGPVSTAKARTSTIDSDLNPVWNESFLFLIGEDTTRFSLTVYDKDVGGDDTLGKIGVLTSAQNVKFEQALDVKGSITYTSLSLPLHVAAGIAETFIIPAGFEFKLAETEENYDRLLVTTVLNAKVRNADWIGKSDPYVWLRDFEGGEVFENEFKGPWQKDILEPFFNETYTTLLQPGVNSYSIHLYDYDDLAKDLLGKATISLDDLRTTGKLDLDSKGFVVVDSVVVSAEVIAAAAQGVGWYATTLTPGGIKAMRGWTSTVHYFAVNDNATVEVTVEAGGSVLQQSAEINETGYGTISMDFTPEVKLTNEDVVIITTKILLDGKIIFPPELANLEPISVVEESVLVNVPEAEECVEPKPTADEIEEHVDDVVEPEPVEEEAEEETSCTPEIEESAFEEPVEDVEEEVVEVTSPKVVDEETDDISWKNVKESANHEEEEYDDTTAASSSNGDSSFGEAMGMIGEAMGMIGGAISSFGDLGGAEGMGARMPSLGGMMGGGGRMPSFGSRMGGGLGPRMPAPARGGFGDPMSEHRRRMQEHDATIARMHQQHEQMRKDAENRHRNLWM